MPPGSEGDPPDRYSGTHGLARHPTLAAGVVLRHPAQGRFFVYVIDGSGSMIDDDRFARATIELRRSVMALQSPQQFEVIFYNEESIPMPGGPSRARPITRTKASSTPGSS